MDQDINPMRKKLEWYTYQATYEEYNEQEVEYIIKKLKESDTELEKEINLAGITFTNTMIHTRNNVRNKPPQKNVTSIHKISFIAIAAVSFIVIFIGGYAIAGKSSGAFYFIEKEANWFSFFVFHEPIYTEYKSYEELPTEWKNLIWIPEVNDIQQYGLDYIRTKENPQLEYIVQYYVSHDRNDFFEIKYYFEESYTRPEYELINQYHYYDILISCYSIASTNETQKYFYHFQVLGLDYSVEASDPNIGESISHRFIEFLK